MRIELRKFFLYFLLVMRWLWLLILNLIIGDMTWMSVNQLSVVIFIDSVEVCENFVKWVLVFLALLWLMLVTSGY